MDIMNNILAPYSNGMIFVLYFTSEPNPATNNPTDEIDTDGEDGDISPMATVVPSNTPVTGDSGQGSPNMQVIHVIIIGFFKIYFG